MITLAATWQQVVGGAFAGIGVLCLLGCVAVGIITDWHRHDDDDDRPH